VSIPWHPGYRQFTQRCYFPGCRNLLSCTVAVANIIMLSDPGCPFGLQFTQRLYDPGCYFPGCRNSLSCAVAVANIIMLSDPGCPFGLQFTQRLYDPGCHFPGCRNLLSCTVAVANIIMLIRWDPGLPVGPSRMCREVH
jgi:hypothetical protein